MKPRSVALAAALLAAGCAVGGGDGPGGGPPEVALLAPSGEAALGGAVQVVASIVTDDTFEEAELTVDGVSVRRWSELDGAELAAEIDTTALSDGLHELGVHVRSAAGRASATRMVRVDNVAPVLEILDPIERVFIEDGPFAAVVRVADAAHVHVLRVRVDGLLVREIGALARDTYAVEVDPAELLPAGLSEVRVRLSAEAEDDEGRLGMTERMIRLASRRAWTFDTLGRVWSAPEVLPDGAVAVSTSEGVLHVVEPDGTERCHLRADGERGTSPPASVPSAPAVVWGTTARLRVVSTADCSVVYTHPLSRELVARPVISPDGLVRATAFDGTSVAFRPDGSGGSSISLGDVASAGALEVRSSPDVSASGVVYQAARAGSTGGALFAIHPDGTVDWVPLTAPVEADLLVTGDAVYAAGRDGSLYCYGLDLTRRWIVPLGDATPILARPALFDGDVVVEDGAGRVHALDPASGESRWVYDALLDRSAPGVGLVGRAGLAVGPAGDLVLGDALGMVHVLGPGGAPRFHARVAPGGLGDGIVARPALGPSHVLVGTENQQLVALVR